MLNDRVPVGNGKESWSRPSSLSLSLDQFGSSEATWKCKFYEGALGWYKFVSGFFYSSLCLIHVTNDTQIANELKFVVLPAACHNFSQLLPISALSPFFQNASLASRAPVVFFALLFSKAALYDEPESSEGALETN